MKNLCLKLSYINKMIQLCKRLVYNELGLPASVHSQEVAYGTDSLMSIDEQFKHPFSFWWNLGFPEVPFIESLWCPVPKLQGKAMRFLTVFNSRFLWGSREDARHPLQHLLHL